MAKAMVTPKEFMNRPTIPAMNATGRNTAMSERVMAMTASPTSLVPSIAASRADIFFSSMYRKMISSTITASSMTIPTARVRARRVITFKVKPIHSIAANVAMRALGMATAAMIVGRSLPRKSHTIPAARNEPRIKCSCTAWTAARMNSDWSRTISIFQPGGSCELSSAIRSFKRSTTAMVLVPDCFRT